MSELSHWEILEHLMQRQPNGLDITRLSELSGIPRTTLYSMRMRNHRKTSFNVLHKLSVYFDVPYEIWDVHSIAELEDFIGYAENKESSSITKRIAALSSKSQKYLFDTLNLLEIRDETERKNKKKRNPTST